MQEVFEKIIYNKVLEKAWQPLGTFGEHSPLVIKVSDVKKIVKQVASEYEENRILEYMDERNREKEALIDELKKICDNGWIPCSERLPENEKEVEITYTRQDYKTGKILYLTARAFYEDGTLTTEDSGYGWGETDNWEYCEEKDACIIPEGWYEGVSFSEEFGIVDMPVIAWRYLTEPYKPKGE